MHRIGFASILGRGIQRAAQVVGHAEDVLGEFAGGVFGRVFLLALQPLAQVLALGGIAQQAVLQLGDLGLRLRKGVGFAGGLGLRSGLIGGLVVGLGHR